MYLASPDLPDIDRQSMQAYRQRLLERMGLVEAVGETQEMAEAGDSGRIGGVEATLRIMDQKLDRMSDGLHDLDTRQRLLEAKVETLANTVRQLDQALQTLRSPTIDYSRAWLIITVITIIVVLGMLMFISSRLL